MGGESSGTSYSLANGFKATSWIWRLGLSAFVIGYLCHVISFGAPFWLTLYDATGTKSLHMGLWNNCSNVIDCEYNENTSSCMNAIRVFGVLATLSGSVVWVMLLIYIKSRDNRRGIGVACVTLCLLEALCAQITLTVYGRTSGCLADDTGSVTTSSWSWAMGLSLTSVVLSCIAGLSFLVEELRRCSRGDNFDLERESTSRDGRKQRREGKLSQDEKGNKHKPGPSDWS